jgi:protein-disulfide isomerase
MSLGTEQFGVTGTPGNVLINNKTGEYQILPGAYPVDEFKKAIDSLKSAN